MEDVLVPIALFVAGAYMVVKIADIISEGRTRRRLMQADVSPEVAASILAARPVEQAHQGALLWGLLIGAIGVAMVVVHFLPYERDDPLVTGVVLIFASAALLGYHAVSRKLVASAR